MTIQDSLGRIKAQLILGRTVGSDGKAWEVNPEAIKNIQALLSDTGNYQMPAVKCLNCGFLTSSLLVEKRCPNCGSLDLEEETQNLGE